jgi:hypothetical protein
LEEAFERERRLMANMEAALVVRRQAEEELAMLRNKAGESVTQGI